MRNELVYWMNSWWWKGVSTLSTNSSDQIWQTLTWIDCESNLYLIKLIEYWKCLLQIFWEECLIAFSNLNEYIWVEKNPNSVPLKVNPWTKLNPKSWAWECINKWQLVVKFFDKEKSPFWQEYLVHSIPIWLNWKIIWSINVVLGVSKIKKLLSQHSDLNQNQSKILESSDSILQKIWELLKQIQELWSSFGVFNSNIEQINWLQQRFIDIIKFIFYNSLNWNISSSRLKSDNRDFEGSISAIKVISLEIKQLSSKFRDEINTIVHEIKNMQEIVSNSNSLFSQIDSNWAKIRLDLNSIISNINDFFYKISQLLTIEKILWFDWIYKENSVIDISNITQFENFQQQIDLISKIVLKVLWQNCYIVNSCDWKTFTWKIEWELNLIDLWISIWTQIPPQSITWQCIAWWKRVETYVPVEKSRFWVPYFALASQICIGDSTWYIWIAGTTKHRSDLVEQIKPLEKYISGLKITNSNNETNFTNLQNLTNQILQIIFKLKDKIWELRKSLLRLWNLNDTLNLLKLNLDIEISRLPKNMTSELKQFYEDIKKSQLEISNLILDFENKLKIIESNIEDLLKKIDCSNEIIKDISKDHEIWNNLDLLRKLIIEIQTSINSFFDAK